MANQNLARLDPNDVFPYDLLRDEEGVWAGAGKRSAVGYGSDEFARSELLRILNEATDLGSMSPQLHTHAHEWPARYYLSAERCNLLRPFAWNHDADVLEVGSGCGTITRFLGETFRSVVAVEGEHHRARVGAARSRDQENVAVVSASYGDLSVESKFDLIFCIGVLEYAPKFSSNPDPILRTLRELQARLAPGGALVLAIENQLGLKYLSGAAEDHTGVRYDGVEGYRRSGPRGPRTLGRRELEEQLNLAGFGAIDFVYPFPDYKFPRLLASEVALQSKHPQVAEMIGAHLAVDYRSAPTIPQFNQRAVWQTLSKNGLLADLSNSFLVVASVDHDQHHVTLGWDLAAYNMSRADPTFWTHTTVRALTSDAPVLERFRLSPAPSKGALDMLARSSDRFYESPTLGQLAADAAMARRASARDIAEVLKPWLDFLQEVSDARNLVPGSLVDAIPQNLVLGASGPLAIDHEWVWKEPLPATTIISRGLAVLYSALTDEVGVSARIRRQPVGALMVTTARAMGLSYGVRDLAAHCRFETRLLAQTGYPSRSPLSAFFRLVLPAPLKKIRRARQHARDFLSRVRNRLQHLWK